MASALLSIATDPTQWSSIGKTLSAKVVTFLLAI